MKKYLKKFGIMFVMALILSLGFCVSAFADDGGVVGTSNLNGTAQNSAAVGDQLTAPEIGWKRYDDSNSNISYIGTSFHRNYISTEYDGSNYGETESKGSSVKFNFTGNKIRIIHPYNPLHNNSVEVYIDGIKVKTLALNYPNLRQVVAYENTGLSDGEHSFEFRFIGSGQGGLDAVDIDANGVLKPYNEINESISLDQSTMNLNVGDSQQLTATTTPAGAQVVWSSSDESVAKYDPTTGKVIAVGEGTCTITATINDGSGLSASCVINVTKEDEPSNPTNPDDPTDNKTGAILIINLTDGETKVFDVSATEAAKFKEWYNTKTEYENQITYEFDKTVDSSISVEEDVVHDQITSYEIRKY